MAKIYGDITETIGNTPLVRVKRLAKGVGAHLLAGLHQFLLDGFIQVGLFGEMLDGGHRRGHDVGPPGQAQMGCFCLLAHLRPGLARCTSQASRQSGQ